MMALTLSLSTFSLSVVNGFYFSSSAYAEEVVLEQVEVTAPSVVESAAIESEVNTSTISIPKDAAEKVDYEKLIGELIANPKALNIALIVALLVLLSVQLLKSSIAGKIFKGLSPKVQLGLITLLGQVYAFVVSVFVLKEQTTSAALIGLISSGGAVAIFNAIKLLFEKDKDLTTV